MEDRALATTVLFTSTGLAALYRFAAGTKGRARSLFPGAILAALVFHAVSWAFSTYVRTLAKYTAFYGGLAGVAMLLIWLWLSSLAILVGAEANAVLDELRGRTPPRRNPSFLSGERAATIRLASRRSASFALQEIARAFGERTITIMAKNRPCPPGARAGCASSSRRACREQRRLLRAFGHSRLRSRSDSLRPLRR